MVKKTITHLIFLFCLIAQVIPVIRSGTSIENGIGFWGPNGHDGVWHLALINQINNPFVINMPIFSGEILKNYHPFFDIFIAYISKITSIPPSYLLFQIFPIISAFFYLFFSFKIGKLITKSDKGGLILILLNTVNTSFGWVINYQNHHNFEGESLFWSMQSPSNQLNPPLVFSLVLLLIIIYILISNSKTLSKLNLIYISLILILLPVIKAYSAIPAFIIFFVYIIKTKRYYKTFLLSLFLSIVLFAQFNKNSSSLLVWQPFWFVRSLFESTDRLYFPRFTSLAHSTVLKQIIFYTFGIPIFLIGNYAFRLLAVFNKPKHSWFYTSLWFSAILLTALPLFFVQTGTGWNTIQFLYYAIFLLNIPLAHYLTTVNIFVPLFIITVQLIPLFASFPQYVDKNPPAFLPNTEIKCLNYLKQLPSAIILTYPYNPYLKSKMTTPIPLYAYETTSYVSAYSKQITYLADEMNLANSGYDWKTRRQNSDKFFLQQNIYQDRGFLLNNQIDYIYLAGSQISLFNFDFSNLFIKSVFQNQDCQIYKILK
ncbi:hypothetical protein COS53_04015 [Candidatus Shapirobacteria bacterium CG03_land_8_20_14_0_80_35_14]|uniref:Glycosyltransferase RgtA/B/C/D-like domain-containing protein n=1 Tax=Candidatus Shapirobacteria bacterium CG03_land_8_20_14_0_80_35_14 TaxID=1974878 RepID=A0A2M7BMD3_9BACT|nr:MAG: hypothetical protein COS53_04015 [Candidatus Shapirobacteria bacterium CG03_land_8_20_14_0_80_35_14]